MPHSQAVAVAVAVAILPIAGVNNDGRSCEAKKRKLLSPWPWLRNAPLWHPTATRSDSPTWGLHASDMTASPRSRISPRVIPDARSCTRTPPPRVPTTMVRGPGHGGTATDRMAASAPDSPLGITVSATAPSVSRSAFPDALEEEAEEVGERADALLIGLGEGGGSMSMVDVTPDTPGGLPGEGESLKREVACPRREFCDGGVAGGRSKSRENALADALPVLSVQSKGFEPLSMYRSSCLGRGSAYEALDGGSSPRSAGRDGGYCWRPFDSFGGIIRRPGTGAPSQAARVTIHARNSSSRDAGTCAAREWGHILRFWGRELWKFTISYYVTSCSHRTGSGGPSELLLLPPELVLFQLDFSLVKG